MAEGGAIASQVLRPVLYLIVFGTPLLLVGMFNLLFNIIGHRVSNGEIIVSGLIGKYAHTTDRDLSSSSTLDRLKKTIN
jgi:hypothetical protein